MSNNRKAFEDIIRERGGFRCDDEHDAYEIWQAATEQSSKEIAELRALVAMQAEALEFFKDTAICSVDTNIANEALSASSETVEAWKAKMLEPLQRQVAMLYEAGNKIIKRMTPSSGWATVKPITHQEREYVELLRLFANDESNTKATAEAYDREHSAKVLEEAIFIADDEARIRESAGMKHPEDSPERDRCFAGARAAHNIAIELAGRISSLRATKQVEE